MLVAACVALMVVALAAQTGIFDTVSVDSTAADAVDIAGGISLGVTSRPRMAGCRRAIGVSSSTSNDLPAPLAGLRSLPFDSGGSASACLYAPSGAAIPRNGETRHSEVAMRDTIKGCVIGALVAGR